MKAMKVYLAASILRREEMRAYRLDLERQGHLVTSSWLDSEEVTQVDNMTEGDQSKHYWSAQRDLGDIRDADTLILFTDQPSTTGGYHVEFGYAFALCKSMVVIGPVLNIFHTDPTVYTFSDWATFLNLLANKAIPFGLFEHSDGRIE